MANDDRVSLNSKQKNNRVKGSNSPHGDALSSSPLPSFDMYRGFFPLWRKIVDWGWYKEGNTARVFIHLLLKANREKKDYLGHTIYPGQVVTGRKKLSVELGLTEQQIRTAIKHLKSTSEVTSTTHRHFSILTLNNWKKYLPKEYSKNKKTNQLLTSSQPAPNQLLTTTNKDKKDKKDKNSKRGFRPPTPEEVSSYCKERKNKVDPQRFIDFYSAKGWFIGQNKMKDWRAAVRTWEQKNKQPRKNFKRPALIVASELKSSQYSKDEIQAEMIGKYTEQEVGQALERLF